jgi:hypothetical protein
VNDERSWPLLFADSDGGDEAGEAERERDTLHGCLHIVRHPAADS